MGLRGPVPTPTRILQSRGSRHISDRAGEVTYPVEAPSCPAWLGKEAKAEWKRQVKHLVEAGVIAEVDRAALAAWCEAWGEFRGLVEAVEAEVGIGAAGWASAIQKGLVSAKGRAVERLLRLSAQFGFTPAARTRIKGVEQPEGTASDGKARFFAG